MGHPDVARVVERIRRQTEEVDALMGGIDDAIFTRRPAEGRWSVAEHLAHLPRANRPYLAALEGPIRAARARGLLAGPERPFRGSRIGRWFVEFMEPPPRRRTRTPRKLRPPEAPERDATEADWRASQAEVLASLEAADGLDLDRVRMRSPFFFLLRLPAINAYQVLAAHNARHIWLMRETLDHLGSPVP